MKAGMKVARQIARRVWVVDFVKIVKFKMGPGIVFARVNPEVYKRKAKMDHKMEIKKEIWSQGGLEVIKSVVLAPKAVLLCLIYASCQPFETRYTVTIGKNSV